LYNRKTQKYSILIYNQKQGEKIIMSKVKNKKGLPLNVDVINDLPGKNV